MMPDKHSQLVAEKGELERLLSNLPESRQIERIGLESRVSEIEEIISEQLPPEREPVQAKLIFRGKPIIDSYGVYAEFGTNAVNAFVKAVSSIGASMGGPLGARGKLPERDGLKLIITGTVPGSFGFQLEGLEQDSTQANDLLECAIEQTKTVMQATLGDDNELADALVDMDPRAIDTLRKFLDELEKNDATCAFEFKEDIFRFSDVKQLRRSIDRLKEDNIREEEEALIGQMLGVLPNRRMFEFQEEGKDDVITGKIDQKIMNLVELHDMLRQSVRILVSIRRIGTGQPRYTLLGCSLRSQNDSS